MARRALLALALCAAFAGAAYGEDLGTLFYTPAERAALDRLRRGEAPQADAAVAPGMSHAVTGYVKRSDGRGVVWIDGHAVVVRDPAAADVFDPREVRAYARGADSVKIERSR